MTPYHQGAAARRASKSYTALPAGMTLIECIEWMSGYVDVEIAEEDTTNTPGQRARGNRTQEGDNDA